MRSFVLIACLGWLSSCVTQSKCERLFPTNDSTSTVYREIPVYIHDTVWTPYVDVDFDTSSIGLPVNIEFKHTVKKGHVTGSVEISKGKLTFNCKADSLQHVVDSLIIVTSKSEFRSEKSKPIEVEVLPWWAKPCLYWFIGSLAVLVLWLGYKYLSGWVRGLFR